MPETSGRPPETEMHSSRAVSFAAVAALSLVGTLCASTPGRAQNCPGNPDAIGTSRVIAISPADYPRVGTLQYPATLPLDDHEVVLTFDDGPLPPYSSQILDILAAQCVKALFFNIGSMARAYPAVTRRVHDDGHTLGTHSERHPGRFGALPLERMRDEIDQGIADVGAAAGDPSALAPFFRIPGLARSDLVEQELAARGLTVFSTDASGDDWHRHIKPAEIVARAISRLDAEGRGILLLHDIHPWTVAALPNLLSELKAHGYRIVQVVPAGPGVPETIATLPGVTVAWTMAAQNVMDDSGAAPGWPNLELSPLAGAIALPTPAIDAFGVSYAPPPMSRTAEIETEAAPATNSGAAASWPAPTPDLSAASPQLPAPSVADIGWPVEGRVIAEREPPKHEPATPGAGARGLVVHSAHERFRHVRPNGRAVVRPVAQHRAPAAAVDRRRASLPHRTPHS